jgi:ABC-2 type transport system ATP-binding protein
MPPFLEVVDVSKSYGSTVALDGIRFQVDQGEMFGLLGPNGAGKTTLLSILSCLLDATAGEVRLLGQRIEPRNRAIRHQIGIVPQELAIYDELTARENLFFFGELYGLAASELERRCQQILAAVGLTDRAGDRIRTYSGGMKRRLNLGVALVHQPKLLLLDEPTVGVDPQSRNHIFEEVRRLNANGMTIIYTSHYMEEVQTLCPRIGIIDQGRLRACDTLPNLLKELAGLIRFRVSQWAPALRARLKDLPGCRLSEPEARLSGSGKQEQPLELHCQDVKGTLLRLIAALNEAQVELMHLETEEPNLERVFLHLTGRTLRD